MMLVRIALVVCCVLTPFTGALSANAQPRPQRPVIVIPGILGTKLCSQTFVNGVEKLELVWGALFDLPVIDKLRIDAVDETDPNMSIVPCGLLDEFAVIPGLFGVSIYRDLISELEDMGFEQDKTLHVFQYNWRASNYDLARQLEDFIEAKAHGGQVDIVAHSMGGIIVRVYLEKHNHKNRVGRVVFLGTPHRGAAQVFKTATEGWGLIENLFAGGTAAIRDSMFSWPAVYELISLQTCCRMVGPNGDVPLDLRNPELWRQFPWFPERLKTGQAFANLQHHLLQAERLGRLLQRRPPAGVKYLYIGSDKHDTAHQVVFTEDLEVDDIIEDEIGDEAVVFASATNNGLPDNIVVDAVHTELFSATNAIPSMQAFLGLESQDTRDMTMQLRAFDAKLKASCGAQDKRLMNEAPRGRRAPYSWALLTSDTGVQACVTSVRLDASPMLFAAGAPMRLRLEVKGHSGLDRFLTKPTVIVQRPNGSIAARLTPTSSRFRRLREVDAREYSFSTAAPERPGFYRLTVDARGLSQSSTAQIIAVVARR